MNDSKTIYIRNKLLIASIQEDQRANGDETPTITLMRWRDEYLATKSLVRPARKTAKR